MVWYLMFISEISSVPRNITSAQKSEILVKDSHIDILDDSTDELMILCSQAVEESHVRSNEGISGKRLLTSDYCQTKKQKIDDSPKSSKQKSNSNAKMIENSVSASLPVENKVNKVLQFGKNVTKTATVTVNNKNVNNNTNIDNLNYQMFDCKNPKGSVPETATKIVKKSDKLGNYFFVSHKHFCHKEIHL